MCSYPLQKWLVEENQLAEKDTRLYQLKAIEIPAEIFKKLIHHPNVKSLSTQAPLKTVQI